MARLSNVEALRAVVDRINWGGDDGLKGEVCAAFACTDDDVKAQVDKRDAAEKAVAEKRAARDAARQAKLDAEDAAAGL